MIQSFGDTPLKNGAHLVAATKLQRTPSWNAAFMRQIWARRRLLPDESGVPVAVQDAPLKMGPGKDA